MYISDTHVKYQEELSNFPEIAQATTLNAISP